MPMKYLPISVLHGRPGSLYAHNLDRLRDLWKLRGHYAKQGILHRYAINLIFWYFAYTLLIFPDEEEALEYTKRYMMSIPTPNTTLIGQSILMPVLQAHWENTPFLLSNLGFKDKFNITDEMVKELDLKTVSAPVSVTERVKKTRKKTESKREQVRKRRNRVISYRATGVTVAEIAAKENVSISTIEGDLRHLRKIEESRLIWRFRRKQVIARILGKTSALRMFSKRTKCLYFYSNPCIERSFVWLNTS